MTVYSVWVQIPHEAEPVLVWSGMKATAARDMRVIAEFQGVRDASGERVSAIDVRAFITFRSAP